MLRKILLIFALSAFILKGYAHEVRPAYLELRQSGAETYDVLWKVPGLGDNQRLALDVVFPSRCSSMSIPQGRMINNSFTERWTIRCPGGLNGDTIRIDGLSGTTTDVLVRMERIDGGIQVARMTPSVPFFLAISVVNRMDVVKSYTMLGIEHILTGIDHLLFVLALLIITQGGWKLVKTVTAFTVSHSISLTLATLGYVHIPQKPVEATIALSIVFVAAEIVHQQQGRPGITARAPWIVALIFGLIHGLGFAGGLSEAGLPAGHIPTALLFFSLGVESGHFLFIGFVLLVMYFIRYIDTVVIKTHRPGISYWHWIPPYFIGSVAMFWMIQRILAF